ncbi:MAG: FAD-dependent oxidoreductase [Burkholderiaceae bacterium]|jgi:NADH dehydrogenase FAD-containing subunit|nr:FAD-dependent oxidoreductase [Burkholderiaceae bacterium]
MTTSTTPNRKHLVLLGAGRAHVQVLKSLAQRGVADVDVTLVTSSAQYVENRMLAGYVAGQYTPSDLCVPFSSLVEKSGVNSILAQVLGLDPAARQVPLAGGDTLSYDVLSIDMEPAADREVFEAAMPGARQHALFVRPNAAFVQLWPRLCELAMKQALHVAVIGQTLAAAELAMTAAPVLAAPHGSRITWVAGSAQGQPPLDGEHPKLAQRVLARLKHLNVTVLHDHCIGLDGRSAQLASGASLQCDAPIITDNTGHPAWLLQSGLQLTESGAPQINERLQSDSHRQIFIAPPDAGAEYGSTLDTNLRAALGGGAFSAAPRTARLHAVASGEGQAIRMWGPFCLEGRQVWHWLNRYNRKQLTALFTV